MEARTRQYWERRGLVLLGLSIIAGVLAWGLSLEIGYALVKWACRHQQRYVLAVPPAAALIVVAGASAISWSCFAKAGTVADDRGGRLVDSSYFVAQIALGLNVLLTVIILTWVLLPFMLSPCE